MDDLRELLEDGRGLIMSPYTEKLWVSLDRVIDGLEAMEKSLLRIADWPDPVIEVATGNDVTVQGMKEEAMRGLTRAGS